MKKPQITMTVIKEDAGYSANATSGDRHIFTEGETFDELKSNILDAVNLAFEDLHFIYSIDEVKLTLDLQSFFDFYKVINAKALSARIGMNQSLLAQYISGSKKPSTLQRNRILKGVQQIGRELSEIQFLL
jgi:hypothetical protein